MSMTLWPSTQQCCQLCGKPAETRAPMLCTDHKWRDTLLCRECDFRTLQRMAARAGKSVISIALEIADREPSLSQ